MSDKSRPHLLIADDHAVFTEALRMLLEKTYVVVGIVADGRALVSEAIRLKPDVVVVDIGMPLINGWTLPGKCESSFQKSNSFSSP